MKQNARRRSRSSRGTQQQSRSRKRRDSQSYGHRYRGNGSNNGDNAPPIIVPVKGTELEMGVWPSGNWGPAIVTNDGVIHRSYLPRDLVDFPRLLFAGARYFVEEAQDDLDDGIRDELNEFSEKLDSSGLIN